MAFARKWKRSLLLAYFAVVATLAAGIAWAQCEPVEQGNFNYAYYWSGCVVTDGCEWGQCCCAVICYAVTCSPQDAGLLQGCTNPEVCALATWLACGSTTACA